jgi:membrane-associated protein
VVSLVYGGYLFGNMPIIRDNLGIILIVGIGIVLGPLLVAGLYRWAARTLERRKTA